MEEQIVITPENDEQSVAITRENISVGGGAVNSVNGQTGNVVLDTSDLENTSDYQTGGEVESAISSAIGQINVPTKTSELVNNGSDGTSTYVETDGLATVATSGSYSDLDNKPTIPTVNDATLTITQNGTSKGTFTANDSDDTTIEVSDTTYSNFVGTDGNTGGTAGLVPAPATTDADKFLKSDGTWATAGGGGGPTVVQTTGTSTTDVMSQNAASSMIFANPGTDTKIKIGSGATLSTHSYNMVIGNNAGANGAQSIALGYSAKSSASGIALGASTQAGTSSNHGSCVAIGTSATVGGTKGTAVGASTSVINEYSTAIGSSARARSERSVALGASATVENSPAMAYSVALGANSITTRAGEVNIGTGSNNFGYNSTPYRVIGGVHDGQDAHDAVTVGQINTVIDAINSATGSNISHIGT